jgi:hypothetical protein
MGKSHLIEHLAPRPWMYNGMASLEAAGNHKEMKSTTRGAYLVNFEELAVDGRDQGPGGGLTKGKLAALKAWVTAKVTTGRGMYTAENESEWQSAVFAASAQVHIYDLTQEGQDGMRKFWEFKISPPSSWKKSDSTPKLLGPNGQYIYPNCEFYKNANKYLDNIQEVYKLINEKNEVGYFHPTRPEYAEMCQTQNDYCHADAFSMFLSNKGWEFAEQADRYTNPDDPKEINNSILELDETTLVKRFSEWQKSLGNHTWQAKFVLSQINTVHYKEGETLTGKGKAKYFYFKVIPGEGFTKPSRLNI